MSLTLRSTAFEPNREIPIAYTKDGENISPPLAWSGAPNDTQSYALVLDDPDAPSGDFVHWVAWNIPAKDTGLPQGIVHRGDKSEGTLQGRNTYDRVGYDGPSPPPGKPHHYVFRLYALDDKLSLPPGVSRAEVDRAMQGHILDEALLVGTYAR
jgi:Raf kinase inhibitor-like YbhB/YbcL family protein